MSEPLTQSALETLLTTKKGLLSPSHPKLQPLARYLCAQKDIYSALLSLFGGAYALYDERAMNERMRKLLVRSKDTLREAILCEDYEEEGKVNAQGLRDAVKSVCEDID